jgi:hypothetical protein
MRQRVYAGRFLSRGIISAAGVIASLAFALPARAESRRHDGFYAAANIGVGYLKSSGDGNPTDMKGITTPLSLWIGSTYGKVAFGGGLTTDTAWYPTYTYRRGEEGDIGGSGFSLFGVALFADIYPDPKGGFHIMPSLGWGFLFPLASASFPNGLVLGAGVGYDFWVGSEVSMGVMARLTYAPFHEGSDSYTTYAPALLYTVTYH